MKITILYFQSVRRVVGLEREELDLAPGARVEDAIAALLKRRPGLGPLLPGLAFALNQEMAPRAATLSESDTLALLPPFSGG